MCRALAGRNDVSDGALPRRPKGACTPTAPAISWSQQSLIQPCLGGGGRGPVWQRLGDECAISGEVWEALGLGLADRDELIARGPHVVDQPAPLPPDRLGVAGKLPHASLGILKRLVGFSARARAQLVGFAMRRCTHLLALPGGRRSGLGHVARCCLAQFGCLALRGASQLLRIALRYVLQFLRLAFGLLEPRIGPRARAGGDLVGGLVGTL